MFALESEIRPVIDWLVVLRRVIIENNIVPSKAAMHSSVKQLVLLCTRQVIMYVYKIILVVVYKKKLYLHEFNSIP